MGCGGGSTKVEAPKPSAQELEYYGKINDLLDMYADELQFFKPYLMEDMGFKQTTAPTTVQVENPEWAKWNKQKELYSRAGQFGDSGYALHLGGDGLSAPPSSGLPSTLGPEPARYIDKTEGQTSWAKMSPEEYYESLSPLEQSLYDISVMQADRTKLALEGKLPISPALEEELGTELSNLESYMGRKLGPNWRESTPGIQSLSKLQQRHELIREEARRGELGQGQGLNLQNLSGLTGQNAYNINQINQAPSRYSGLLGGYQSALQPYQYYGGLQYQANAANAASSAQRSAGLMGGLGSLLSTGMNMYGMSRLGTGSLW